MNPVTHLVPEPLLNAFGWSLIHALWQGALVALMLAFALVWTHDRKARLRYHVAVSAMAAMLLMWVATFLWYLNQPDSAWPAQAIRNLASGALTVEVQSTAATMWSLEWFKAWFNEHLPLLVTCWMMGSVMLTLRFLGGLAYTRRLKHYRTVKTPAALRLQFDRLCALVSVQRPVKVVVSTIVHTPMVIGHLKPVVLMPASALTGLSARELECLILHELGHIIRNDYLVNLAQSLAEILFFYHPAVWWISSKIRDEREHCCDDIALAHTGDPLNLAKALTHLQEAHMTPTPQLAMAALGRKSWLFNRIRRMLPGDSNQPRSMERALVSLLLVVAFTLFAANTTTAMPLQDTESFNDLTTELIGSRKGKGTISYKDDDRQLFLKYKDGLITKLRVDGKNIPKEKWPEYQSLVEEFLLGEQEQLLKERELLAYEQKLQAEERAMAAEVRQMEREMREKEARLHREINGQVRDLERERTRNSRTLSQSHREKARAIEKRARALETTRRQEMRDIEAAHIKALMELEQAQRTYEKRANAGEEVNRDAIIAKKEALQRLEQAKEERIRMTERQSEAELHALEEQMRAIEQEAQAVKESRQAENEERLAELERALHQQVERMEREHEDRLRELERRLAQREAQLQKRELELKRKLEALEAEKKNRDN